MKNTVKLVAVVVIILQDYLHMIDFCAHVHHSTVVVVLVGSCLSPCSCVYSGV